MKKTTKVLLFMWMLFMISFGLMAQSPVITGDSTINQCETKTYNIGILNNTSNPLTGLKITAKIGNLTGFSYVTGTASIDVDGGAAFCTVDPVISGTDLLWDIDAVCPGSPFTLNNGSTLNISFSLATDCNAVSGSLNIHFEYNIGGTPMTDDTGAHSIQVLPGGITIKKTPNVIPQELWQNVTWTLTIENTGFGTIKNVVVTDEMGVGLAYVSSTPAGVNAGQTTTWGSAEIPGFSSMNPGQIITIDITAQVIACENLENKADARWGCDLITPCYNTAATLPPSTATASVQRIVKTPLLQYTPPNVSFNYCDDYADVGFTITNIGDGRAHDVWIGVDFGSLTVSDVSAGAIYNNVNKRFELTVPLLGAPGPGNTYDLSFRLNFNTWCGGSFPTGELLWQTVYNDDCDNPFYPPVELSVINPPANSSGLTVGKTGAPATVQIGAQITYTITSAYSGALNCGSGGTGDVTVVDDLPDGFTVLDAGGGTWIPDSGGTGGTVTWTYTPPATLNTSITVQVPNRADCETYCFRTFANTIMATVVDCCGCTLSDDDSQTTAIECEELVDSEKTAVPAVGIRCGEIQYTNTYTFADNAALDSVDVSQLVFREDADHEQEYVAGSLQVTLTGAGDITACALAGMTDATPGAGGTLDFDFTNCSAYGSVRNKTLTITYRLKITESTVGACAGLTFYSWSSLNFDLASGSECLPDGTIYETTPVAVEPPAMSLSISGLGQIIDKCRTETITLTLTQTSATANPRDVRLTLSGLNYYVVNPAATVCSGDVAPTSCTPTLVGDDYVWYFADGFNGSGQRAVLQLTIQKRCTGGGDLAANAYFDDNCHDDANYDDSCNVSATDSPLLLLSGDLLIEKNPEVYYASTNTVEWKIYVTNRGNGSAYNVWIDDVLGAGLDYSSAVVDNMTGVTITADQDHNGGAINGCTIAVAEMTAGQRREVTFQATLLNCNNLTNDVSTSWGCVGVSCQAAVSDSSTVEIPRPLLINTNVVTTPADACSSPSGMITLKNAGQTTCYNLQITETLPAGLLYVTGSTRWRLNGGGWNGPNAAYDPNPTVSPLNWTKTEIPGLATSNPGDVIEIDYDLSAACPFLGGNITVATSYENPCGQVFNTADSVFTVAFRQPRITVTKTRTNEPIDCGQLIEWTITVQNTSGYTLPIIWVEDTMDAAFTYSSSVGDPTYTSDNGTVNGQVVTWEVMNIPHNGTATLTLRATTDTSPCSPNLDNTVLAWWGCGAVDGSSATKPGVDPPDNTLCLTTSSTSIVRTETREPSVTFMDIALNPTSIDSCDDSTELTVTIQNTGPTDASNVDLAITLPTGITYNPGTSAVTCGGVLGDPAPDPVVSGNQLIYYNISDKGNNLCDLVQASGGNDTLTLVFSVRSNCYVTANVGFRLYYYDCCGDAQYDTTTSETLTSLYPALSITKTPQNNQVDCAANQTWTVTVTNNGTGNAQVVRIEDTLGNWLDYVSSAPAATPIPSAPTQVYGWEINNLAAGASQSFDITGQLNPDAPQADCAAALRQNNVRAIWGCGVAGDAVDNDPNTTGYDCTYATWANATAASLAMPDLAATAITPAISCTSDGVFNGTISVTVRNQGNGIASGGFQVSMNDGAGWTGVGSYVGNLAAGAETTISIDVTSWGPDCSPCTYNFSAAVDSGDTVCECREDNNTFGPQAYSPSIPNLQVDNDTLAITCVADGQYRISGTVTLRNAGCAGTLTQDVPMRFTLFSGAGCTGAQVGQWTQTFTGVNIAAGAAQIFTITNYDIAGNACTSASGCQFSIRSEADYTNVICECDGTDNTRCSDKNFTLPDLRVVSDTLAISCSVDGQIRIQGDLVVANDGCGGNLATNIPIRIRVYNNNAVCNPANPNGNLVFNQAGVNIPAGGTQTFAINRTLNRNLCTLSTGCQAALGVELDYNNTICECSNANNNYCSPNKTVSIPDLQVTGDALTVTCLQDGQVRVSGTATIANTGCNAAVAGNLPVRFTLFSNINCGGVQVAQWTETFAGVNIAAGGSQVLTITNRDIAANICTNSTGCQVSLQITADPGSVICECNGGNNTRCSNKTVSVPDLRITAVTPSITCTSDGSLTGTVLVTVNNNGCGAANNIPARLTSNCGYTFVDQTVAALAAGASTTLTFSFTPNIAACTCTFTAAVDPDNVICECDGTNNSLAAAAYTSPVPDLVVGDIDFSNIACANDNISGNVRVTVNNQGCGTANNFQVSLATDGCLSFSNQGVVTLAAGASTTLTFNIGGSWADCTVAACQFTATVDPTSVVCEYDGTNNTRVETYNSTLPDLVVNDIDFSNIACANDNISGNVVVTIYNRGVGNAANFQVALATDGCLTFTNQTVANLAAGATTTVTFNVGGSWADCTDCDCLFTATVDATNTVCECNGTNNNRSETYTSTLPDLRVNSVTPTSTCTNDSNFQGAVTVNVSNTGCGAANNAVVRLTSSCGYVFSDQTVNLAVGANANLTFTYTPTCPNCSCTFTAVIDPANVICECNGANNSLTSGAFNLNVPDVTVDADTLAVACAADGQVTVSGQVTLGNRGCGSNLIADVPVRITLYDNTGCGGNQLDQWTQTFSGVNIAAGGGSQSFTITNRTITGNLATNSTNCRVSLRVEADYNDSICECDGTNNSYCTADKNVDIPDLHATADTLGVACAADGQATISGTVTMTNSGCGSNVNANIPVRFTLFDNTGCGGNTLLQWTQTFNGVNIAAGGGTQVFPITPQNLISNLATNSTNCRVSIRVEVDYTNSICESDNSNNTYCADNKAVDIPDIEVPSDALTVACSADGQVTVSGTVTLANNGCGSNLAANVPVRITLYDNTGCSGNQVAQWTETLSGVSIPAGGGTQALTITPYNITSNLCANSTGCQVSLRIEADYTASICESDGTDNERCSNKTIAIPELTVNSVTPTSTCTNDSNFQGAVTVNVGNTGCAIANNAVVRLTSSCGYVFADQTVNLAAGANTNVIFTYTPTCPNCSCTFTAVIDPDDAICECNGANNSLTSGAFALDVPDVTVETDALAVTCADDGQVSVTGTVTLGNHGCGSNLTANVPMRFTLFSGSGCTGSQLNQWTETLSGVNIAPGGGTQTIGIALHNITTNLVTNSTNCRVSLRVEADYTDSICECDGTNNDYCTADKNVDIPDIRVAGDALGVTCAGDGQVTVSGTVAITNSGCGSNLNANIPVRFTLFDNIGCSGNTLSQWTETLNGVNITASGGTQIFTITNHNVTANLVANSTNCRVSIRVEADYTNSICESDGTNNTRCADNKAVDIPDIEVPSDALTIACSADGQVTVSGTVTLANNGCGSNLTTDVPVRFTLYDDAGCGGNQVTQWTETLTGVNISAGGGTQTFTITAYNHIANMCANSTGCRVSLRIEADYTASICESDGTDNERCSNKAIAIPELTVNNVTPTSTCTNDSSFQGTVTVNVGNTGCAIANNAVVRLTSSCGYVFADQTVNLAAGASTNVIFTYTPTCPNCSCTFTAVIDPDDAICECNGANNSLTSAAFALDVPDVTVETDALAVTCADDGQVSVAGTVTLGNHGCGSNLTANVPVRFTLFSGSGCTGSQLNQWTETLSGVNIAPGGGTQTIGITLHNITTNLVTNSTNCRVSLRVEADYNDSICECDGTNNDYCTADKNVDIPDIQVSGDALAVSCAADGQVTVSGTVTMTNSGCGSNLTAAIPVRFTLYDNTGCSGNTLSQWTETLSGVNITAGGGTQVFTITDHGVTTNLVTNSTNCRVSIRVEADYPDSICESDGTNNTRCADNKPVDIPDIVVQADNTVFTCTGDGQFSISGSVTLQNNGCGSNLTADIPVRFTLHNDSGCSGAQVTQWTETLTGVNIPANGGTQAFTIAPHDVTASLCANATNCRVSLNIEADYTAVICESDGTNNTLCSDKTVAIPNLIVNTVASEVICRRDGSLTGTTVTVSNTGCGAASGVVVRLSSDCGLTFNDQVVDLAAGETKEVFFYFTSGIVTCTCNFTAVIDPDNLICECDGTDNTGVSAQSMLIPDIVVQSETLAVNCVGDGNIRVSGTVTLGNRGCGPNFNGSVDMRFTLFNNTGCTGNQVAQWTETLTGARIRSAGGTQTFTITAHDIAANFCTSSTNCNVSILVEADYDGRICEWDGTNNTLCTDKTSDCLDLQAEKITAATSCQANGTIKGAFTITIRSSGGKPVTQDFSIRVDDGSGWSGEKLYHADLGGKLPLAPGESSTVTFDWTRDFTVKPYICEFNNIVAVIDSRDNICECAADNNQTTTTCLLPYPDLVVKSFLPVCSADGQRRLQATIGNDGCGPQNNDFNINFTDHTGQSRTVSYTSIGGVLPLGKGASGTVTLDQWAFDCSAASTEYTITMNITGTTCDLAPASNTFHWTQPADEPDLLMDSVDWTCNANGSITFNAVVSNRGHGDATGVQWVGYGPDGNEIYSEQFSLAKGETKQVTFTTGVYPKGKALTFRFVLDDNKSVCECDGSNNEKIVTVNCPRRGGEPGLKISKTCPAGLQPGGLFKFEIQIINTGETDLANVMVEDFLPERFSYVPGSSSLSGKKIADPQLGNPLVWQIGDVALGSSFTLVYTAVADADIDPGRYCNKARASAVVKGDVKTVTTASVQCCTVVTREPGANCCLNARAGLMAPFHWPEGPLSFIEPYFHTESAMFTVYASLNLWKDDPLEKESMPLFIKERLQNYARSTVEEFYLGSRLGLTLPDGTLWLSYGGAYPEQDDKNKQEKRWLRHLVQETMTSSQVGFELLALNETLKIEKREDVGQKIRSIINMKLDFLSSFIDDLPHGWQIIEKKKEKAGEGEIAEPVTDVRKAIKENIKKLDDKATLFDNAALYLSMVELNKNGFNAAAGLEEKLGKLLKPIDNKEFDPANLREEFIFTLALLQAGQSEQAKAKVQEFEKILAAKKREETRREVLDNLNDYALAAAVDYKAGGTQYNKIKDRMKEKYYMKDSGILADVQPDFTFKLTLQGIASLVLSFDAREPKEQEQNAAILYRIFDEVGLFLKKRNLNMGNPLYSLLKNYPFSKPLLPILSFTRAKQSIAPVFSRDAVVHSTQVRPLGENLIPRTFSKILSPGYETGASRIAALSFALQYYGGVLAADNERVVKEEGRSFRQTGKEYVDALLKSGAGILSHDGNTLLAFDNIAVKGPKQGEFSMEPLNSGTRFSTETLANYLLAEKLYVHGDGRYAETVRNLMTYQARIVAKFQETGYVPEKFDIHIDRETDRITLIPSKEPASKMTVAKFFHLFPAEKDRLFLGPRLETAVGLIAPEDLIFLDAVPELIPYFKKEIKELVDAKDSKVSLGAADVIGRRMLKDKADKIRESEENLARHWDRDAVFPKSDRIENIEKGLIYHHEPQQFILFLLAVKDTDDFRFKRTLNFFTYLLENEWGVENNDDRKFVTLPSQEYQVFKEDPREEAEPGDILTFKVNVANVCPQGFGAARDIPALYLKSLFTPPLLYAGSQVVDGLDILGDFQWRYGGLVEGAVLDYTYQAFVPYDFNYDFIDGTIYADGRQGFQDFGPETGAGDRCQDTEAMQRLRITPYTVIQGLVYEDRNVNGVKDVGEPGIPNILIKDTRGRILRNDAEGRFSVLAGNEHEGVQVELKSIPPNFLLTENPTRLVNRHYVGEIYFGLIPCKTVAGFVYIDENGNGEYDANEVRPSAVTLSARDKQVVTSKDGQFIFRNLPEMWQEWIKISETQLFYKEDVKKIKIHINN